MRLPRPMLRFLASLSLSLLVLASLQSLLLYTPTIDWRKPVTVVLYPINADGQEETKGYIGQLREEAFDEIEDFFRREAVRHGLGLQAPVTIKLEKQLRADPPQQPAPDDRLEIIAWGLMVQAWAAWHTGLSFYPPKARIFIRYHSLTGTDELDHSLGLEQGRIGLVNGFADQAYHRQNLLIISHELLHTFGASDKYDFDNRLPLYPQGYAEPRKEPLYPQAVAEIMGGRIPLDPYRALFPPGLELAMIGPRTATEIGWTTR